jgi:hypothetical protein
VNSHIKITLEGEKIGGFIPTGVNLHYGINSIPTAEVQLDPASLGLLCDFDSIRRSSATITVETTNGCFYFDGIIDGLSINQSFGSLSTSLIIKHPAFWLTEVYPRIVGIHPSSDQIFNYIPGLNVSKTSGDESLLMQTMTSVGKLTPAAFNSQNLVDFFVSILTAAVDTQRINSLSQDTTAGLYKILEEANLNRLALAPLVTSLLSSINTEATKGFNISAASRGACSAAISAISGLRDNIFSCLVRLMSEVGCCIVVGSSQIFVIPEASFLRIPKLSGSRRGKVSSTPNITLPAEYDNYNFVDNGYAMIKGVYVTHDANTKLTNLGTAGTVDMGAYIDSSAIGNILVTTLPTFISYGMVEAAVLGSDSNQKKVKENDKQKGGHLHPIVVDSERIASLMATTGNSLKDLVKGPSKTYMNQWAEVEYCRLKYGDRTGNFSAPFRNNHVPGAVGTLYTRMPGTFIDFFVTGVTHSFDAKGEARTSVSFKCGRQGAAADSGLENLSLFNYNYDSSVTFCSNFLRDISS